MANADDRDSKPLTKASDFPPEVLSLFDKYVHNVIDRRGFLEGAAKFAAGGLTAAAFLEALSPRFAEAQQVRPDDPRLQTRQAEFPSPQGHGLVRGTLDQAHALHLTEHATRQVQAGGG